MNELAGTVHSGITLVDVAGTVVVVVAEDVKVETLKGMLTKVAVVVVSVI